MSRALGWPERHSLGPARLRQLADALERLDHDQPQPLGWEVDVVAPEQAWAEYDAGEHYGSGFARVDDEPAGWFITHHRAAGSSSLHFGPFGSKAAAAIWLSQHPMVHGTMTPIYLTLDWSR